MPKVFSRTWLKSLARSTLPPTIRAQRPALPQELSTRSLPVSGVCSRQRFVSSGQDAGTRGPETAQKSVTGLRFVVVGVEVAVSLTLVWGGQSKLRP